MEAKELLLTLIRLGVGVNDTIPLPERIDWEAVKDLAIEQGLSAIVLDGLERIRGGGCDSSDRLCLPSKLLLVSWIGGVVQDESIVESQMRAATEMAHVFYENSIKIYVLKGMVVAECYPRPAHRRSVDMDCFLLPSNEDGEDVWELGNNLMEKAGFKVKRNYYKNSTIYLSGLTVENHRFMTPFRGNARMGRFEKMLQSLIRNDRGEDIIEGTWLFRPPVILTALFLIEHAYSHFLHEGLTWRHILDWMMFSQKHKLELDWDVFDSLIDEYGFRRFYDSYFRLGRFLLGELGENELTGLDGRMMEDVWAPLDLHETNRGVKGKLALAGNTWRARWKYRYFSDISMLRALWIQAKGVLFLRHPSLD